MNLKFYLRGLGIGIVVTAVIMLILSNINSNTLSDEQIKEKAAALGMVEEKATLLSLADNEPDDETQPVALATPSPTPTPILKTAETVPTANSEVLEQAEEVLEEAENTLAEIQGETVGDKSTETPKETETPKTTETPKPTQTPKPTATPKPTETPKPTATPTEEKPAITETVTLVVNRGEGSYTVAKRLQSLGLIEDAGSFDTFLCNTGKDRRICAGSFEIPQGSSEEEIAKIISG